MNRLDIAALSSELSMRPRIRFCVLIFVILLAGDSSWADSSTADSGGSAVVEDLLRSPLEVWKDGEVLATRFKLPAGRSSKKHSHPGEGFLYVVEGSMIMQPEGGEEVTVRAGEITRIPMGQIHRARPGSEGVEGIVFRVHPKGAPERQFVD